MGQPIPEKKQTVLGLYVTSAEAYEKWRAAPDEVNLLDVRTPEEFIFVGHREMAWCIPLGFQSYRFDAEKDYYALDINQEFVPVALGSFGTKTKAGRLIVALSLSLQSPDSLCRKGMG